MSNTPVSGEKYMGIPTDPKVGTSGNKLVISVTMLITEGELKGWKFPFKVDRWTNETLRWDMPSLRAAGWRTKESSTFVADVLAFAKQGVPVQFEAKLAENPHNGNTWWTCRSIGVFAPTIAPASADDLAKIDSFLADYQEDEVPQRTQPQQTQGYGTSQFDAPPVHEDDLPF